MRLCRVVGNVVATVKHPMYQGQPLMIVQPIDAHGRDVGASFLAVDRVQAGPGDHVIVLTEGTGVRQILELGTQVPIRSLIVGIVDAVDVPDSDDDAAVPGSAGAAAPDKPQKN
jgi:ethanolamine utilization protein EutN